MSARRPIRAGLQPFTSDASEPLRLRIPVIGVDTPLVRLGLHEDQTLEVPKRYSVAGWYSGGPAPGETGPAVVVGHVDSRSGPAVFHRLAQLGAGDRIEVERGDGATLAFTVSGKERIPKEKFPTDKVYAASDRPVLRLITCGGEFDRSTRHYRDNVIVYADLVASSARPQPQPSSAGPRPSPSEPQASPSPAEPSPSYPEPSPSESGPWPSEPTPSPPQSSPSEPDPWPSQGAPSPPQGSPPEPEPWPSSAQASPPARRSR